MVNNGAPYNNNTLFFPSNINNTSLFVDLSINFSQPISNLRIRFVDLDENVNGLTEPEESISQISPPPTSVNSLGGSINTIYLNGSIVSSFDNNSSINNNDAAGWVNWTGSLSSVNFRYNRPGALYALIIDSIYFDCPTSGCVADAVLGQDISICNNQTTVIDASNSIGNSYLWGNGEISPSINVNSPGVYYVTVSDGICTDMDSISVFNIDFEPNLLNDSLYICPDDDFLLSGFTDGVISYVWNNGLNTPIIYVSEPGLYWVEVFNGQCSFTDTINVVEKIINLSEIPSIETLCSNEILTLNAFDINVSSYSWNTGETTASIQVTDEGEYWVLRQIDDCEIIDNIHVELIQIQNQVLNLDKCMGESILLQSIFTNNSNYTWSNGSESPAIVVNSNGVYILSSENECGTNSTLFNVVFNDCNCDIFIPNSFTPDEDEFNQVFEIKSECIFLYFHFQIFDRWGEIVFESYDQTSKWDGTYGEQYKVQDGIYTYILSYKNSIEPERFFLTGHITLIK
jgi:gliding motility-associated-like protein